MTKKIFLLSIIFIFANTLNGYSLCVDKHEANLRSGAGAKFGVTWKVFKFMPLQKVSAKKVKKKTWFRVKDIDGDIQWVTASSITSSYKCAVVNKDNVNVKKSPKGSSKNASISPAKKYYSFKVITKKKNWVKVMDEERNSGWISKNHLWIR
ncbi:MAG: hypothetical protein HQK91_02310 [Nitrospirae bacterium]|nr:hypothetical protein [Nitrospirota bacterium]MBF0540267.1 hypothetical protein [Nitrospirota bacterium]